MLPDHGVALVAHSGAFPCSTHTRVGAHTHVRGNAKSRHYAPLTPLMGRSPVRPKILGSFPTTLLMGVTRHPNLSVGVDFENPVTSHR